MTVLAGIDENERSERIVEIAADLARTYDDTLLALHVVPTEDFESHSASVKAIPGFTDFSIEQEKESAQRFASRFAREVVEDDDVRIDGAGRVGDVTEELLAAAEEIDPRFLVVGGRRRSPVGKAVFGNTAQQILLNASCPVVTQLDDG